MKRLVILLFCALFVYCCQEEEMTGNNEMRQMKLSYEEMWKENWESYNKLEDSYLKIFLSDPQFTDLCDRLDLLDLLARVNQGEVLDSVVKNYSSDLELLLNYGLEAGVDNITAYKKYYLKLKHPVTKEVIVRGQCELKNAWEIAHKTCREAYNLGLIRYWGMWGCCETRFKNSIEKSYVYIGESDRTIVELFFYVLEPYSDTWDCDYYTAVMDRLGIQKLDRYKTLMRLNDHIEFILEKVALNQQFWVPCTCGRWKNKGQTTGITGNTGITADTASDPSKWGPIPDFDKDYPVEVIELTKDVEVTLSLNQEVVDKLMSDQHLEWFIGQYGNNPVEYGMSFNMDITTGRYIITEPYTVGDESSIKFKYNFDGDIRTTATVHNHPTGNPHSMTDILALAKACIKSKGALKQCMVCAGDKKLYVVYVKEPAKAEAFYNAQAAKKGLLDARYQRNAQLINAQLWNEMDFSDISMYATAAVLDYYDSGMVMLKMEDGVLNQKSAYRYKDRIRMTTTNVK